MKILHFSDLHLDTPFVWAPTELARARRRALRSTLERICQLAAELNVDALTCGGDLYENERFTPDTAEFLRVTFGQLPMPVLLAPGNHDWYGPRSLYSQVDWPPNVHVFGEDRLESYALADGFTLWGAAHRAPANTAGFLENFRVARGGVNIGLFHGSAMHALIEQGPRKLPHAPFRVEQIREAGLHHALLGHFHSPSEGDDYTYPGNPDPLSFGETGLRGVVLITVADDGGIARERHRVATSCVYDIDVDLTGATNSSEVGQRVLARTTGLSGVARVTLHGDVGPDVDVRLQDIPALRPIGLDALIARLGCITVAYDFDHLAKEPTVRGQFVRDVRAATDLSDDEKRRVLVTGLRALDGRNSELDVG